MRIFTHILSLVFLFFSILPSFFSYGQSGVLNPSDPIVVYNPAAPPVTPPFGTMSKWVKTNRLNWNTSSYKAYFYKGIAFRLKFPKSYQHNISDGKSYPIFVFFHGIGERGTIYDNEFQLYHGGQLHSDAVDQGKFDGFLLYIQSSTSSGFLNDSHLTAVSEIIQNYLVPQVKGDINRVFVDGLSGGGSATWDFTIKYPKLVAGSLPISAASVSYQSGANASKFIPIWHFQGELDPSPTPYTSKSVRDSYLAVGTNYKYTEYVGQGHGCWYSAWNESDYFPFMNRNHKANPWTLFGRTEFCPGDPINVTIGVTSGFDGYEWRKDGLLITGATSNQIVVNNVGVYDCRIKRGTVWSPWSPTPVTIKIKGATVPPTIQVSGLMSKVIPAPDGNTGVKITVPQGYATYTWQKVGNATVLGSTNILNATSAGDYTVKVTEQFGCSSDFSTPFKVINSNGPNKPDAAINLSVTTLSKTSLRLNWNDNPLPQYNETNFEVYQASQPGGPYKLISIINADILTVDAIGLNAKSKYYFIVRAVNQTGASPISNEANGTTDADVTAPIAPTNLRISGTTRNSISLAWNASSDDVGVTNYDISLDGIKAFVTPNSEFTLYNLVTGRSYNMTVSARDFAGNISPKSNQVTGQPLLNGLNYKYYTFTGTWNNLPDFNALNPISTGIMPNVAIVPRTQDENFAFLWEGVINIPVTGTYTFRTNSDDGSKLYLGALNQTASPYSFQATALVNNDGLHGPQNRDGTIVLTAGTYPIAFTFYEQGGGESMNVSWSTPQTGGSFVPIPNSAFSDASVVNGTAPLKPGNLAATSKGFNKIELNWTDNSDNETAFEIWRSSNPTSTFITVGQVNANNTSFVDSGTLNPSTTYYYKIRSIGKFGESEFSGEGQGVNYSYYEVPNMNVLPDFNSLTPVKTGRVPGFNLGTQNRGDDFAYKFEGIINITTPGLYTFFTTSDDGSNLYIDGFDNAHKVVGNDYLQGPTERSGTINLSAGAHFIYVTFFERGGGEFLEVRYQGPSGSGISKQLIPPGVLGDPLPNATTLDLPSSPVEPTSLLATSVSTSSVNVSWNDLANNEDNYEIYRSGNNNENFVLLATLPPNTLSFKDSSLFANAIYYYRVRAVNLGGSSNYSNEDSAKTDNNKPVLTAISNQVMRYGTNLNLTVTSTDVDPGNISIQVDNLPSFATYSSTGVGTGTIIFTSPLSSQQGLYSNITVRATDEQGGYTTLVFDLNVNDNFNPDITPVANITLNERQSGQINLTASDPNSADILSWSFIDLPSFVSVLINSASAQLTINPGYADAGTYKVTSRIEDGNDGYDTASFTIIVNNINPNRKIFINFTDGSLTAPAPWNNTNKVPALNDNFANLKDDLGGNSGAGLLILSSWQSVGNGTNLLGVNTGNNSGVYPDAVIRSTYWSNTTKQTIRIYGLNAKSKYNFTFFGSRGSVTDNRTSMYTIGSQSVSLNAAGNRSNTVTLSSLQPATDGTLVLDLKNATGSSYSYLNAMVIENIYDDSLPPAKPRNLTAQLSSGNVLLNWTDAAFNETGYEIYRSLSANGPFVLQTIPQLGKDVQIFSDANVVGNTSYYYTVRSINTWGVSSNSDTVSIATANTAPILNAIANVIIKNDEQFTVNISATDDFGDIITLSATGLPVFASLNVTSNGVGSIMLAPTSAHIGTYTGIVITAKDDKGATSTRQFNITVSDNGQTLIYSPTSLLGVAKSKTSIQLRWTDKSNNETGFEIYRSTSTNGLYNLVGTVGANVITFTDGGLQVNTPYFYKTRAILNASTYSVYSNVAAVSTFAYVVSINFNRDNPAAVPWNNTNNVPQVGSVYANFVNELSNPTGINMEVLTDFSGENPFGVNTGNNSGIYPDNVMRSSWWLDVGVTSQIKISGLSQAQEYSFVFFGSRDGTGNRTTVYSINGQSVSLNCSGNSTQTVQLDKVRADENGEATITVSLAPGAIFGYLGALVIQASNIPVETLNPITGASVRLANQDITNGSNNRVTSNEQQTLTNQMSNIVVKGYPNPFVDQLTLSANFDKPQSKLILRILDMSGQIVYSQQYHGIGKGNWTNRMNLSGKVSKPGNYVIQITGPDLQKPMIISVIKLK